MQVKFTDDLLTGHEQIDNQHKELFKWLDGFWKSSREGKSIEEVIPALTFLQEYVVSHFSDEEKFQQEIAYPGYEKHKIQHEDFKLEVNTLINRLQKQGSNYPIAIETLYLMMEWVIKHIKGSDKKMITFAHTKKLTGSAKA